MNELILKLIEAVEEGFSNYFCKYDIDNGITWDDDGEPISYDAVILKQDTTDIMKQLEIDCKNNLIAKDYAEAVNNILVLERLNNLYEKLEQEETDSRVFVKDGKEYQELDLTEQWLDDQYTLYKFEQWLEAKGYNVV